MSADHDLAERSTDVSWPIDHGPEPWRPEIVEALYGILYRNGAGVDRILADVQEMESREGPIVHVELLHLLSHIRFEPDEAREHWNQIIHHRAELEEAVGFPMDLTVALVSYFVHVSGKLRNPKVIELKLFEETRASAYKDELTGLYNFRFLQEFLRWEVKRCDRGGGEFTIMMGDIDNFKDFNDRLGHAVGNDAIQSVGEALQSVGRDQDVAVRYGGEEFVLVMPETSKDDAGRVADRVCSTIAGLELSASQPADGVTMSIGVASFPGDALSPEDLLRCADRAMYTAKAKGKNQVQLYGANRRALPRVEVVLEGEIRSLKERSLPFSTVDVSERGLRFTAEEALSLDSMVEFVLNVPGSRGGVRGHGRVVRVFERDGLHQMALSIIDLDKREYTALTRYLRGQVEGHENRSS